MEKVKKINRNFSINILFLMYLAAIILFVARLFDIQVLQHRKYSALAQGQYWNLSVIPARRGDILSSDNVVLAGTETNYLMYAEPKKIVNKYETAHKISEYFSKRDIEKFKQLKQEEIKVSEGELKKELDEKEVFQTYYNEIIEDLGTDLYWLIVMHNITPLDKKNIEDLKIDGIGFEEEPIRYYPEGSLAAHILGFVAYNERGEKQGYFGIEGAFDGDLRGKPGRILEEKDALGNPILVGSYKKSEPVKGRDIVLTVNRAIQYTVEKKLKEGVEKYNAKSGTVIVMDPFTGDIIAMANYPDYTPGDLSEEEENQNDKEIPHRKKKEKINLAISQTFEPGSVIKPVTVSAAIELGKINPNTTFDDRGPVVYSDYTIDNWDGKHHGVQNIAQLLQKSNNIGAAWVGHVLGAKNLSYFFKEFGLGNKSEIELQGEDTGTIRDYSSWTDIDIATASFGQGVSATPLQVLNAFNVIANGGFLLQPKIVSKIIDENEVIDIPTKNMKRVISKDTSDTMVDLLEGAAELGEAKFFILKDYRISAKTGTAQIPFEGKYDPEKTNATFVGFLTNSKKFSMIVKLEEPTPKFYASETAAPLWMDITKELVKYYGIPPDRNE